MKTQTANQNYLSIYEDKIEHLDERRGVDLTIFLVDDNKVYLQLLEQELCKNPKHKVHSFLSGEECLEKLYLKPDIAIVDYHLDGNNRNAQNGDVILGKIKSISPDTEVIIFSGDDKVRFVNDLMDMGNRAKEVKFIHKEKEHEFVKIKKMLRIMSYDKEEKVLVYRTLIFIAIFIFAITALLFMTGIISWGV